MSDHSDQIEFPAHTSATCNTCGEPVPDDAPQGLCPKCVLKLVASSADSFTRNGTFFRFQPPDLDAVRDAFPQLEIIDLIGCGGMGAVFRARQPHLERIAALKILPPELAALPEFAERFVREGRVLAKLNHPNIVSIYDFGASAGYFYLLMEYIDGANLREAMRTGHFSPSQSLQIIPQICAALQYAHEEGILHRDIKPENILLDAKGRVKIADFGIAKLFGEPAAHGLGLTRGLTPGTPHYMAPEQIEHPEDIDHRADIYSLGVVFYEMLTGELPIGRFAAPSERVAVTPEIDNVVFRSLEKERGRRQQSARQVQTEVEDAASKPPSEATGLTNPRRLASNSDNGDEELRARWERQVRPGLALALVFGGLAVLLLLGFVRIRLVEESRDGAERQRQEISNAESHQPSQEKKRLDEIREDVADIQRVDASVPEPTKPLQQSDEVARQVRPPTGKSPWLLGSLGLTILGLLSLCIPPGTVFAWKQLKLSKMLWLPRGRLRLLVAAWLWPMIVLHIICQIPFRLTFFSFLATPLATISTVLFGSIFVFLTWLWVRRPVHWEFVAMYLARLGESRANGSWSRTMTTWVLVSVALILSYPAVVAMSLIIQFPPLVGIGAMEGLTSAAVILVTGIYLFLINRARRPTTRGKVPTETAR